MAASAESTVVLPAACDHGHAAELREELLKLLDAGPEEVLLDFAAVTHIDSSGLAVVLAFLATLQRERPQTKVVIRSVKDAIQRVLTLTKLDNFELDIVYQEGE